MDDIIKNSDLYVIRNEGLSSKDKSGDLYVMFIIDYENIITPDQKREIWKILIGKEKEETTKQNNIHISRFDRTCEREDSHQPHERCNQQ